MVYIVEKNVGAVIRIGDVLVDLRGNRFSVKAIEMVHRICDGKSIEEMPLGIMFELMDKVEVEGNMLVSNLHEINFLFCNHPLYPRKVDEDYKEEYQQAGLEHSCALFSYEDLERGKLTLYGEISGLTIYRGWIMKPDMYRKFYELLGDKGIILINSPEEYERYHLLPGWYDDFKEYTAVLVWETEGNLEKALDMTKGLEGPYIVKDYVKSRKHEWYDACFIKNIADKANTSKIIGNFIDRQGTSLVGGIVLRQFENLKQIGFHEKSGMPISEEYHVFIYTGKVLVIDNYWCDGNVVSFSEDEKKWIETLASKVKSNFITMDLARKKDGRLMIMELGDGQVSGLQQIKANKFYAVFADVGRDI